eukprot:gene10567-11688_t
MPQSVQAQQSKMCSVCKRSNASDSEFAEILLELLLQESEDGKVHVLLSVSTPQKTRPVSSVTEPMKQTESQSNVSVKEVQWESGAYYTSSDTDFDSASDSASNSESDDTDTETISDDECDEDELEYNDRNE